MPAGSGFSASFGAAGCRERRSAEQRVLLRLLHSLLAFAETVFREVFLTESIFGFDGRAASVETYAVAVALACGFGVSAGSGEPVEAGVDGAVAVGTPSWLAACGATGARAGFAGAGANAGATDSKPKGGG
jgi:hypothetical protein